MAVDDILSVMVRLERDAAAAMRTGRLRFIGPRPSHSFQVQWGNAGWSEDSALDYAELVYTRVSVEIRVTAVRREYDWKAARLDRTLMLASLPEFAGFAELEWDDAAFVLDDQQYVGEMVRVGDGWAFRASVALPSSILVIGRGVALSDLTFESIDDVAALTSLQSRTATAMNRLRSVSASAHQRGGITAGDLLRKVIGSALDMVGEFAESDENRSERPPNLLEPARDWRTSLLAMHDFDPRAISAVNHAIRLSETGWFDALRPEVTEEIVRWYRTGESEIPAAHTAWQRLWELTGDHMDVASSHGTSSSAAEGEPAALEEAEERWLSAWQPWVTARFSSGRHRRT